jgi:uncharacterized protein YdbL (DUF1318 family)
MVRRDLRTFSIQLEDAVLAEFQKLAKQRETSVSALARLACKKLLAEEGMLPEHSPITPREEKESSNE